VWPELPASRPERNLTFEYVWTDLRTKSDASLGQTVHAHGGRAYRVARVGFTGETSQYKSFLVHRNAVVEIIDPEDRRNAGRLFGSVIEKNGRFKVFSYVVDD
jgi:hypothetical protein